MLLIFQIAEWARSTSRTTCTRRAHHKHRRSQQHTSSHIRCSRSRAAAVGTRAVAQARKSRATSSAIGVTSVAGGVLRSSSTCGVIMRARSRTAVRRACTRPTGNGTCRSTRRSSIRITYRRRLSKYRIRYSSRISRTSISSTMSSRLLTSPVDNSTRPSQTR